MARPRTAKHPKPDSTPETVMGGGQEGHGIIAVSKADMVRAALANGMETPTDGLAFIKAKYGIDFPRPMWSSYKAQLRAQEQKKALKRGKPGRKPKSVEGYLAPPKATPKGDADLIDALEAMKPLVASLGKEQVKRLVNLLG
ncbi:MAG: hypothetical protein P4L85_01410 [Paludisphaera borealis]|uniref:hypothetical protein n=1 Tax=Paludisphaera borealis TaxID=1387353 RepID=UPI00283B803C|nr:hypothetical protein [Paludisphaera borealis]MDR3617977.1 hypothetical protein [Paludisphaera borealis]